MAGSGFGGLLHAQDVAVLVLHNGALAVLAAQLRFKGLLNPGPPNDIGNAVAGKIAGGIGLAGLFEVGVILRA